MIPFSVLDLSPVTAGGDAAGALRNTLELARHAERLGYRRFWLAEHHNMPGIASAATAVVIGHVACGTSHHPRRRRRHHAAESLAAGHRRTVRHARVTASRTHRPRPRPRAGHRPVDHARAAAIRRRSGGRVSAGRGGAAGLFPRGATGAAGARGSRGRTEGADLAPRIEPVQCPARGTPRAAVRVCVALRAGSPDGRAARVPQRVPAVR